MSGTRKRTCSGTGTSSAEELSKMLRYRGIGRIVQSHFHQCRPALTFRHSICGNEGEKPIEEQRSNLVTPDFATQGSTNQARTTTQDRDGPLLRSIGTHQSFLGGTALLPQSVELDAIQSRSLRRELRFRVPGDCEIHVVAPEQQMVTDRYTFEL